MKPEQLIAEVETLDKSATNGPWIAGELGTGDAGVIRDSYQDFVGEADGNCWQENAQLIARFRTLAPELAQHCKELQAAPERLTADREDLRAQLTAREEECRELESRRLMAYRAYCDVERRLDDAQRESKEDRARAMARIAELESELATLRAAQTPRPIEEAPKDGTEVLAAVLHGWRVLQYLASYDGWVLAANPSGTYSPTHFLPLPVKP